MPASGVAARQTAADSLLSPAGFEFEERMGRQKQDPRKGGKRPAPPAPRKRRPQLAPEEIDWKNFPSLRRFLSERGKIRSRRITGLSRRQQSQLARAVKRARTMGLFPYPDQERTYRERGAGTGGAAGAPPRRDRPRGEDAPDESPVEEVVDTEIVEETIEA